MGTTIVIDRDFILGDLREMYNLTLEQAVTAVMCHDGTPQDRAQEAAMLLREAYAYERAIESVGHLTKHAPHPRDWEES